ncbi:hypothetical protein ACTHAM_003478 [Cellulomonas soli]|uniref:hypothetical protein n=1 Tax=Cellulomonas soli TaxID=931535 RepID=UPI003F879E66
MFGELSREVRGRLRTLSKENADRVGRHLVMVGRLLDDEPELAYEHAQAAVARGGRVDVVREAAGLAAYRTGRYAEALRELRTVRRLNGSSEHLPVMADCERGLGRPERALALAQDPEAESLEETARVELAIVVSGARLDLGQPEAAVATLAAASVRAATGLLAVRVAQARATALDAAGQPELARAELARYSASQLAEAAGEVDEDEEVVVFDLTDEDADEAEQVEALEGDAAGSDEEGTGPTDDVTEVEAHADSADEALTGHDGVEVGTAHDGPGADGDGITGRGDDVVHDVADEESAAEVQGTGSAVQGGDQ